MVIHVLNDTTKNAHAPQSKLKRKMQIPPDDQSISFIFLSGLFICLEAGSLKIVETLAEKQKEKL